METPDKFQLKKCDKRIEDNGPHWPSLSHINARFTFAAKLTAAFFSMLVLAVTAQGLALWTSKQAAYHIEQSALAHDIVAGYLNLSRHTFELFKQFGDALLIKGQDSNNERRVANLVAMIEKDLEQLRVLTALERARITLHDGLVTQPDLGQLVSIDRQITQLIANYRSIKKLKKRGKVSSASRQLAKLLEENIDIQFTLLLNSAIESEALNAVKADAAAASEMQRLSNATNMLLVLSVFFCILAVFVLRRSVHKPLLALSAGTRALASGNLGYRIPALGQDEFAGLARRFNRMAADLGEKTAALKSAKSGLEKAVKLRTKELEDANARLEKLDRVRRRFLADVSHELRTPLTIIRGEGEIALRGKGERPDEYRQSLKRIVGQVGHITKLVDDLLFIARRDSGDFRLKLQTVSIGEFLKRICGEAAVIGEDKDNKVSLTANVENVVISGDPDRLRQLLLILLDNAIRYSLPSTNVEVTATQSLKKVMIEIRDYGIGIEPDDLDRVFERFYRGGNALQKNNVGTGLGLPMAKAIVDSHNGLIEIESEPQKGTTVTVALPTIERIRAVA